MLYSESPRCGVTCNNRAILSEAHARKFETITDGRLHAYECPDGHDWHVWMPVAEPHLVN